MKNIVFITRNLSTLIRFWAFTYSPFDSQALFRKHWRILRALLLFTMFSVGMVVVRGFYTDVDWSMVFSLSEAKAQRGPSFLFLVWNLFLAIVPMGFAFLFASTSKKSIFRMSMLTLWLLFLPNSFYIVTDLFHLKLRLPIPLWYDTLLLFGTATLASLYGFLSCNLMEFGLRKMGMTYRKSRWLMLAVLFASSIGVYVGRFLRWNSWDVFTRPKQLVDQFLHILADSGPLPNFYLFTFGFAIWLAISYEFINALLLEHRPTAD